MKILSSFRNEVNKHSRYTIHLFFFQLRKQTHKNKKDWYATNKCYKFHQTFICDHLNDLWTDFGTVCHVL